MWHCGLPRENVTSDVGVDVLHRNLSVVVFTTPSENSVISVSVYCPPPVPSWGAREVCSQGTEKDSSLGTLGTLRVSIGEWERRKVLTNALVENMETQVASLTRLFFLQLSWGQGRGCRVWSCSISESVQQCPFFEIYLVLAPDKLGDFIFSVEGAADGLWLPGSALWKTRKRLSHLQNRKEGFWVHAAPCSEMERESLSLTRAIHPRRRRRRQRRRRAQTNTGVRSAGASGVHAGRSTRGLNAVLRNIAQTVVASLHNCQWELRPLENSSVNGKF